MRTFAVLAIGVAIGFLIAFFVYLSRPSAPRSAQQPAPAADASLRLELDRAREEIASLQARLAAARAEAEHPRAEDRGEPIDPEAASAPDRPGGIAGAGREPDLRDREARALRTIALLDLRPELREIHTRHSREESGYPQWTSAQFLEDPAVNPRGESLEERRREDFILLFNRTFHEIKALELKRQLAVAEAVAWTLEESRQGREPPLPAGGVAEEDLTVSLRDGFQIILPRASFPEIHTLRLEKEAAIIDWLQEARRFLGPAR